MSEILQGISQSYQYRQWNVVLGQKPCVFLHFRVDKWVNEGATAPATQPRDTRTPGRIAAERGEIARPMEPITNLPEDGGDINVDSIPF